MVREEGQTIPLSRGLFRQEPSVVFAWIDAEKAEFPITTRCQVLQVSPSGFYASRGRPESTHAKTDRRLRILVRASFDESRQRYGSPRIHEDLMAIVDLFSRFIVGWAVSAVNDRHLTIAALEAALTRRCPEIGLLHHSDQGSTYASEDYQDVLEARGIVCSMSRRGNCHDNALAEPVIGLFNTEVIRLKGPWRGLDAVEFATLDWVDWFNHRRLLEPIGYVPPAEYEARDYEQAAVA